MIITERFVMLNFPKTGSSFARAIIKEAHNDNARSRRFPTFPDLTFSQYYDLIHLYGRENKLNGATPGLDLGNHTIHFIQFYFPDPEELLNQIDAQYVSRQRYLAEMPTINFLHQERLNEELHNFLRRCDYPPEQIDFILGAKPVNVTRRRREQQDPTTFYTPALVGKILERDRMLFDLFPEYRPGSTLSQL